MKICNMKILYFVAVLATFTAASQQAAAQAPGPNDFVRRAEFEAYRQQTDSRFTELANVSREILAAVRQNGGSAPRYTSQTGDQDATRPPLGPLGYGPPRNYMPGYSLRVEISVHLQFDPYGLGPAPAPGPTPTGYYSPYGSPYGMPYGGYRR